MVVASLKNLSENIHLWDERRGWINGEEGIRDGKQIQDG